MPELNVMNFDLQVETHPLINNSKCNVLWTGVDVCSGIDAFIVIRRSSSQRVFNLLDCQRIC